MPLMSLLFNINFAFLYLVPANRVPTRASRKLSFVLPSEFAEGDLGLIGDRDACSALEATPSQQVLSRLPIQVFVRTDLIDPLDDSGRVRQRTCSMSLQLI
jgi:hypothetical protein